MPTERNVVVYAVLSVVTCGLWAFVWWILVGSDIAAMRGDGRPAVVTDVVLGFLTCGLWSLYCAYRWPQLLNEALEARGERVDSNLPAMSLVMSLFSFQIIGLILVQDRLNKLAGAPSRL